MSSRAVRCCLNLRPEKGHFIRPGKILVNRERGINERERGENAAVGFSIFLSVSPRSSP